MQLLLFIIGAILGFAVGYWMKKPSGQKAEVLSDKNAKEHAAEMEQAITFLSGKEEVTNDELEHHLNVSDTSIGRYLDELEQTGYLQQIGTTGRSVCYKVLK